MYMNIVNWKEDYFHLTKTPGIKSWSLFVGIVSLGIGAAYYGQDAQWLKVMYVVGAFALGLTFLDEWEDFVVDRSKNCLVLRRATTFQKLLFRDENRRIKLQISDVIGIRINCEQIMLVLRSGMQVAVSETQTDANMSEIETLKSKIESFFKLNKVDNMNLSNFHEEDASTTSDSEEEDPDRRIVTSLH